MDELRGLHARVGRAAQQAGVMKEVPEPMGLQELKERMMKDLEKESDVALS